MFTFYFTKSEQTKYFTQTTKNQNKAHNIHLLFIIFIFKTKCSRYSIPVPLKHLI